MSNAFKNTACIFKPPVSESESKEEELFRLVIESTTISERVKTLLTEGAKVAVVESEQ